MSGFIVICGPVADTRKTDAAVAQARAYEWFYQDFMRRFPQGVVMTEYEYIARTTFAGAGGTPVQFPGKPLINKLLDGMSDSFRRGNRFADFRKPDGIGLVEQGRSVRVELLEVTTEKNQSSAIGQVRDKADTLLQTVVKSLGSPFPVVVVGTPWTPSGSQISFPSVPDTANNEFARWICYLPTQRSSPPAGVVLYEVHAARAPAEFAPASAPALSPESQSVLQREYARARANPALALDIGQKVPLVAPEVAAELASVAAVAGVALAVGLVVGCVAAAVDPVPGDEVVICGFALKAVQAAARMAPTAAPFVLAK